MQLVERHIVLDKRFEDICYRSGLLYNYITYQVRQGIFSKEYVKEYDLSKKLGKENQVDFRNLPAQTSQQVIKQVFKNFKSWIQAKKEFEKNPSKFKSKPKLPQYKKCKKQNVVVFTNQQIRLKEGYIYFPEKENIKPLKTNQTTIQQVRIVPQATCYAIEVVYNKEEKDLGLNKNNFLSIDLGLNNYVSAISNVEQSFIINGKVIKSFNQWFNKKRAKLMSYVEDKGTSNKLNKLNNYRNFWIEDKNHKISRFVVNYCIEHNIGSIVIGLNKNWKQNINIGKRNNQKFVEIPHSKLIQKIEYKAKLVGIEVKIVEESYTSKIDHLAFEPLKKQDSYLGKRKKRGLFQSSKNKLLNADINGAIGISRKVFGDSHLNEIVNSGLVFNPVRVNLF